MLDLPPQQQPTQEVRKMDQKNILIQKIRALCEISMELKNDDIEGQCSLNERAYFLDICNTINVNEIFSFKNASRFVNLCQDSFNPRVITNYDLCNYHIEDNDIWSLKHILEDEGKGEDSVIPFSGFNSPTFKAIYTIMVDNPDFTPQFTKFAFGGTMKDMPPLRLEDGKPNPDFFRVWQDKTWTFVNR